MSYKSGFVTIIGNPNVGKSSLFNSIINYELSIVTDKAQTTRDNIKGIITYDDFQLILSDTPGHIESSYLLHDKMIKNIFSSLEGTDLVLYVTDVNETQMNDKLIEIIKKKGLPIILIINKKDLNRNFNINSIKIRFDHKILLSALNKKNIKELVKIIKKYLPLHPAYYPPNELTDKNERFILSEIVREKLFKILSKEVPYSSFVEINHFDNNDDILKIEGYIYIETKSQKKIIIGKNGSNLKRICKEARLKIEKIYSKKVYINFTVKIKKKWRNDNNFINSKL